MLTHEDLLAALHYDPETGVFLRRPRLANTPRLKTWNTRYAGKQAGVLRPDGYRKIVINKQPFLGSRLAFFYMTGRWPIEVDHRDLDPSNDRWSNLREATGSQNKANKNVQRNNQLGVKGVWFHKQKGKFTAQCDRKHLGLFATAEEAHAAYCDAAKAKFGEYARS